MYGTPKYTCSEKRELKTIGLTWAWEVCRPLGPKVDHTTLVYLMLTIKDGALNSTGMKASILGNNSWGRGGISRWCPQQRLRAPRPFSWGLTTTLPQTSMGALSLTPQLLPATCSLWGYGRQPVSLLQLHLEGAQKTGAPIWVERCPCGICHGAGSQAWPCTPGSALLGGQGPSNSMDPTDV